MGTTTVPPRISGSGLTRAARGLARASGAGLIATGIWGPVLIVGVALAFLLCGQLSAYHWNLLGLIEFGRQFAPWTRPPHGAPMSPSGYDGQFYWVHAHDPLYLRERTLIGMSRFSPGIQRLAYPALAFLLAGGQVGLLPVTLLVVNIVSVLAVTAAVASEARRRGRSVWWSLAVGLTPGVLMATMRDLSDPLALAAVVGALISWQRRRSWSAAGLLTLAVLAREPMILGVAAILADAGLAAWRLRGDGRELAGLLRRAAPVLVLPVLAFGAWQLYIRLRWTGAAAAHGGTLASYPSAHPFGAFLAEARRTVAEDTPVTAAWDLVYLVLLSSAVVLSAGLAVARPRAATILAGGLGLTLAVVLFGDEWGLSRYGAPLFALLVLAGLESGRREWMLPAVLAAGLTPLIPVMLAGI